MPALDRTGPWGEGPKTGRGLGLLDAAPIICHEYEQLQDAITRMIERNVMEMPVIEHKQRVIAELEIVDLLESWLKKGKRAF